MSKFVKLSVMILLPLFSIQVAAQDAQIESPLEFKKSSLSDIKDDLYVFCQDKARNTSGYLGVVPGEYTGPNLLDESFNLSRQGGLYDVSSVGVERRANKGPSIGGKIVFSFGRKASAPKSKKKRQLRRDFRRDLDGCLLSKR